MIKKKKTLYCYLGSLTYCFGNLPEGLTWLNIKLHSWLIFITVKKTGHKQQEKRYT